MAGILHSPYDATETAGNRPQTRIEKTADGNSDPLSQPIGRSMSPAELSNAATIVQSPAQEHTSSDPLRTHVDASEKAEIWRMYVKKADEHDKALFKRWNEEIDVFLLFAALFSAVLSAFIIVSISYLQQDPSQATLSALVTISAQLAAEGASLPPYQVPSWEIPPWALLLNALWFISLSLSLFAAVAAMLVKEWLRAYEENTAPVPQVRFLQRQIRHESLSTWMVPSVITFLPLSIHMSVFLFAGGLVTLLQTMSPALSWLMLSILVCGLVLYVGAAVAPILWADCPWKASLFRALQFSIYRVFPTYLPPWRLMLRRGEMYWTSRLANPSQRRGSPPLNLEKGMPPAPGHSTHPMTKEGDCNGREPQSPKWDLHYASLAERGERNLMGLLAERAEARGFAWLINHPDPETRDLTLYYLAANGLPRSVKYDSSFLEDVRRVAEAYLERTPSPNTQTDFERLVSVTCLGAVADADGAHCANLVSRLCKLKTADGAIEGLSDLRLITAITSLLRRLQAGDSPEKWCLGYMSSLRHALNDGPHSTLLLALQEQGFTDNENLCEWKNLPFKECFELLRSGALTTLIGHINDSKSSLLLSVLAIGTCILRSTPYKIEADRKAVIQDFETSGWLQCMATYGIDYALECDPRRRMLGSSRPHLARHTFERFLEGLCNYHPTMAKTSAILSLYSHKRERVLSADEHRLPHSVEGQPGNFFVPLPRRWEIQFPTSSSVMYYYDETFDGWTWTHPKELEQLMSHNNIPSTTRTRYHGEENKRSIPIWLMEPPLEPCPAALLFVKPDLSSALPHGWEMRLSWRHDNFFFVDHNNGTKTWNDPRKSGGRNGGTRPDRRPRMLRSLTALSTAFSLQRTRSMTSPVALSRIRTDVARNTAEPSGGPSPLSPTELGDPITGDRRRFRNLLPVHPEIVDESSSPIEQESPEQSTRARSEKCEMGIVEANDRATGHAR